MCHYVSLSSQGRCSNLLTSLEPMVFSWALLRWDCVCFIFAAKKDCSILIKSRECWAKRGYHFHWTTIYSSINSARWDLFAVRAYQMAHVPLLPIKITRFFSRNLYCRQYCYTGSYFPGHYVCFCWISHISYWPISPDYQDHFGEQPCPQAYTVIPQFGAICKLYDQAYHCRIIKRLSRTGLKRDPCSHLLFTVVQVDCDPLMTPLLVQSFNHFNSFFF